MPNKIKDFVFINDEVFCLTNVAKFTVKLAILLLILPKFCNILIYVYKKIS